MAALLLTEETTEGTCTVCASGELDLSTAPQLCSCLGAHRGERVTLDLSRLEFCDSSGLRALLGEAREAQIRGGRLELIVPEGIAPRRLLELTGVLEALSVRA